MKSAIEVLNLLRGTLEKKEDLFTKEKEQYLKKLKVDLAEELEQSLISSIEHRPLNSCWLASIRYKKEYKRYFRTEFDFKYFLSNHVATPKGFKEFHPKEVKVLEPYNLQIVRYVFTLDT